MEYLRIDWNSFQESELQPLQLNAKCVTPLCGFPEAVAMDDGNTWILLSVDDENVLQKQPLGGDSITKEYSLLRSFLLGGLPVILAYEPTNGQIDFFRRYENTLIKFYTYQFYEETKNLTLVEPYFFRNTLLLLTYRYENGIAAIWSIVVPSENPLAIQKIWSGQWAKTWNHFVFLKMGFCNFFFKINDIKSTVNVDHLMDDPSQGAYPVYSAPFDPKTVRGASYLEYKQSSGVILWRTHNGASVMEYNQFYGDLQSWFPLLRFAPKKEPSGRQMTSFQTDSHLYTLFY